jgi:nitric oxide reductase NorQ protein
MTPGLTDWRIAREPYYRPVGDELAQFRQAHARRLPLLLKGPSGCGKTRFVEHMAWTLDRPLITVVCHEDMTASDLLGRYLLDAQGTVWQDGPLTLAARHGAICYLDELIEARPDALVALHPLADTRRVLPLERKGELLQAHPNFQLVASYNPGPNRALQPATRQRFVALAFAPPNAEAQAEIVARESGVAPAIAARLVAIARGASDTQGHADAAVSTRMLVHAGQLMREGTAARVACDMALTQALDDDPELAQAVRDLVEAHFA